MKSLNLTLIVCASLTVLSLMVWGASRRGQSRTSLYIYVIDYSGSTEKDRRGYIGRMLLELENVEPGSEVVVFRMGSDTEEVFSGIVDETSMETIMASANSSVTSSDQRKGTNFALMAEVVKRAILGHVEPVHLMVLTDGGADFASNDQIRERYRRAVAEICSAPKLLDIRFVGVGAGFREGIRRAWKSAGQKLQIESLSQIQS